MRDGARIAHSMSGRGEPLVWTGSWLTHLELDWQSPVWRHWIEALSCRRSVVRYDLRGSGLSESDAGDACIDTWVEDLEAVVEASGVDRFPLLGVCQGGPIAVEYAARHPERVSHLILYGSYARGALADGRDTEPARQARLLSELIEVGWGRDHPAFREVFAKIFMPSGPTASVEWLGELQRRAATPAAAATLWTAFQSVDVRESAERVRVPSLVLHVRGDAMIPLDAGEEQVGGAAGSLAS